MAKAARTTRIEARITPDSLKVIRRAAEIQGRSVSDFVVVAAQEAASKAVQEAHVIRVSIEDYEMISDAIQNPPPLTPTMERAIARYKERIRSSE